MTVRQNNKRGATGVAYGLVVGLIAIVALTAVQNIGGGVTDMFDTVSTETGNIVSGANNALPQPSASAQPSIDYATCASIKDSNPSAASGVYSLTGTGLGNHDAYCDMDTDGGGWMVVMNYVKPSTQTTLSANPLSVPPLMDETKNLGDYDSVNWGHLGAVAISSLYSNGFTEWRFYCTADTLTSGDPQPTIHMKVGGTCLWDHFGGNNVSGTSSCIKSDGTSLAGDTGGMGTATWSSEQWNYSDQGQDYAITSYPWWPNEQGDSYWTAWAVDDTSSSRWDCTDGNQTPSSSYSDSTGNSAHYIHRVWVR